MTMRGQFEKRLEELRNEYEKGMNEMRELEARQNTLRQTMLRISGAIQVIEEELKRSGPTGEQESTADRSVFQNGE
jgi:prefoldin subunit 5